MLPVIVALLASALGCASNGAGRGEEKGGDPQRDQPWFSVVTAPVAFEIMRDNPRIPLLDLRGREEFAQGHVNRAVNVPLEELEQRLGDLRFYEDDTFLIYCRREDDNCGFRALEVLRRGGFKNPVLIDGGIEGWREAHFGTVGTGTSPRQAEREEQEEY